MAASILIADDDPNIVRALEFLMRREGHVVRVATDGDGALAAVAAAAPDLLLLDVMMPKRDGYEVCRLLRADSANDAIRIVMLTAKGQASDRRRGLTLGVDAYLTKPFAVAEVIDCVAAVLAGRQPATLRGDARAASAQG